MMFLPEVVMLNHILLFSLISTAKLLTVCTVQVFFTRQLLFLNLFVAPNKAVVANAKGADVANNGSVLPWVYPCVPSGQAAASD